MSLSVKVERKAEPCENYDYMFKTVVIGDSGVGKTNLITRFAKNEFNQSSANTIGVEFTSVKVQIDTKTIKAQLWDTAGQERFRAVTQAYYRGAMGALVIYDITKRKSFENLSTWVSDMLEHMPNASIILVGNKTDLLHLREVSTQEGQDYANDNNMLFVETSALNSENVELAFFNLLGTIFEKQARFVTKANNGAQKLPITPIDKSENKMLPCC